MSMKRIKEQTPKEYLVVKVHLVHVKKGFFGYKDKILAFHSAIPDTPQKALELYKKMIKIVRKYGVTIEKI